MDTTTARAAMRALAATVPGRTDGTLADWGGGKYHIEFTVDHGKKETVVYVLGADEETPAPRQDARWLAAADHHRTRLPGDAQGRPPRRRGRRRVVPLRGTAREVWESSASSPARSAAKSTGHRTRETSRKSRTETTTKSKAVRDSVSGLQSGNGVALRDAGTGQGARSNGSAHRDGGSFLHRWNHLNAVNQVVFLFASWQKGRDTLPAWRCRSLPLRTELQNGLSEVDAEDGSGCEDCRKDRPGTRPPGSRPSFRTGLFRICCARSRRPLMRSELANLAAKFNTELLNVSSPLW